MTTKITSLYVHVPFCSGRKCAYCDFFSLPYREEEGEQYLTALAADISLTVATAPVGSLHTLYLGGGTPTSLTPAQLEKLLTLLFASFDREEKEWEFTVEISPETLTAEKLSLLKEGGVNRLSIGAQSFDDRILAAMGRRHRAVDIFRAYELARKAGFASISLDLIYGFPGQSCANWEKTLATAISLAPEHLSVYCLQVEPDTPLSAKIEAGILTPHPQEEEAAMYYLAVDKLTAAGYQLYELSNLARPGFFCRHNLTYWYNRPYLGLGPGAASWYNGYRRTRIADLNAYSQGLAAGIIPVSEEEYIDRETEMAETIILNLRLTRGIDLTAFSQRFGVDLLQKYKATVEKYIQAGLLELKEGYLRLTRQGLFLSGEVMRDFLP
ncbi:MAG: hypothetical protein PWQ91_565 [Eubacteriales bacterium]|nr:hypothetical protein [Eubacteriales bacterium]